MLLLLLLLRELLQAPLRLFPMMLLLPLPPLPLLLPVLLLLRRPL